MWGFVVFLGMYLLCGRVGMGSVERSSGDGGVELWIWYNRVDVSVWFFSDGCERMLLGLCVCKLILVVLEKVEWRKL